jgi:hypothetical protein
VLTIPIKLSIEEMSNNHPEQELVAKLIEPEMLSAQKLETFYLNSIACSFLLPLSRVKCVQYLNIVPLPQHNKLL